MNGAGRICVDIHRLLCKMVMGDRSEGENRVMRGGSWDNNGRNARSAIRNRNDPANRNDNLGFRLARAQHAVGMSVNDQIVILSCRKKLVSKKQGRRCVSTLGGYRGKARRLTVFQFTIKTMKYVP